MLLTAVCFANSLPNGFILDDYQIVAINPAVRNIAPIHDLFTPYWGAGSNAGIYRPLTIFSFSLEYPLWHRWPGGYRLFNLLLHAINGLLVFVLARDLLQSKAAAWAAFVIYLVHPVHTEAVVAMVGRSELLAAGFCLGSWLLFRRGRIVGGAVVLFFLGLLSKENAIVLPAVLILDSTLTRNAGAASVPASPRGRGIVLFVVAVIGYLAMRIRVLGSFGMPPAAQYLEGRWTFAERILTSGRAFLKYFELLIAPVKVAGDYDFNSIPLAGAGDGVAWLGLLLVMVSIVFALGIRKSKPVLGFSILFFYIAILPVSNWIVPTAVIMAERHLYLPSLTICLIGGMLWSKIQSVERRSIVAVGFVAVAVLLTISHNYIWQDELTFYGNLVRVSPDNLRGRQGYGTALLEVGRVGEARAQFDSGLTIRRTAPLLVGLSQALIQSERHCDHAHQTLDEALRIQPGDHFARWLTGSCFEREGALAEAESAYRRAIHDAEFPDPKLYSDLARVLEKTGRTDEAREARRQAASLSQ